MKYNDNGTWKNIYVKALDSMPVGTEVDFDGQASDIPAGWQQVADNRVVLYNDPDGTNGDVTLSQSAANFTYMDIYYGRKPGTRRTYNVISKSL